MELTAQEITKRAESAFTDRQEIVSTWQELSQMFYPENAVFFGDYNAGDEYDSSLESSYTTLARRELSDQLNVMLRDRKAGWFEIDVEGSEQEQLSLESKQWLEHSTRIQTRAMYDRKSNFTHATKMADNDFVTYGNCVLSCVHNLRDNTLLYRNHHLRDVAWYEDYTGHIDTVFCKQELTPRQIKELFGDDIHPKVEEDCK